MRRRTMKFDYPFATLAVAMVALSCGASSRRSTTNDGSGSNNGGQAGDDSRGGASGTTPTSGRGGAEGGSNPSSGSSGTGPEGGTGGTLGGMGGAAGDAGAAGDGGGSTGPYATVAVDVSACALLLDGSVQCWGPGLAGVPRGNGGYERLALSQVGGCGLTEVEGRTQCFRVVTASFQPAPVPLPGNVRYAEIDMAGINFLCGLTADTGEVLCLGEGPPVAPVEGTFTQFSLAYHGASSTFSGCALTTAGDAVCWTWEPEVTITPTPEGPFRQLSAGARHACGIDRASSSVVCWGNNVSGEASPPSGAFDSVSCGDAHSCAVARDGIVQCWGDDGQGQSTPPTGVTFLQVSAGRTATCGVTTDGWIRCWGNLSSWSALP